MSGIRHRDRKSLLTGATNASTHYEFANETIGGIREAKSNAGVELPVVAEIDVDRRKQLLLSLLDRREFADRSKAAVVLERKVQSLGHVNVDLYVRGKIESVGRAGTT